MKKKLKNILKKSLIYGSMIFIINQITPSCSLISSSILEKKIGYKTSKKNLKEYMKKYKFKKDFKAFEYLLIANNIAYKEKLHFFECQEMTTLTYNNYMYLIEKNNRNDLKEKIRLAVTREEYEKDQYIGHIWIQYKENGKIKNFENLLNLNFNVDLKNKEEKKLYQRIHEKNKENKLLAYSLWGNDVLIPTWRSLTVPGGLVKMIYESYKYQK